jgi:hypothetical protein
LPEIGLAPQLDWVGVEDDAPLTGPIHVGVEPLDLALKLGPDGSVPPQAECTVDVVVIVEPLQAALGRRHLSQRSTHAAVFVPSCIAEKSPPVGPVS